MLPDNFMDSNLFSYVILPLLIFMARIFDQSFGILRIIFATKGLRAPAFFVGFFESLIWLMAISQIMSQLNNIFCYLAFAGGFATGNVVGIWVEKKISIGFLMVRVVFQKDSTTTISLLRDAGYRITQTDARGMEGPVKLVYSVIKRSQLRDFLDILNKNNPNAFYTIEDVRKVKDGSMPQGRRFQLIPAVRK